MQIGNIFLTFFIHNWFCIKFAKNVYFLQRKKVKNTFLKNKPKNALREMADRLAGWLAGWPAVELVAATFSRARTGFPYHSNVNSCVFVTNFIQILYKFLTKIMPCKFHTNFIHISYIFLTYFIHGSICMQYV